MQLNDLKRDLLNRELNKMLDVSEAAELIGVSKTTMRRYANEGRVPVFRVGPGRHRRFRKGELLQFLEEG
jgi:excisionase family DNA binding protein